jgi:hypothetical protein
MVKLQEGRMFLDTPSLVDRLAAVLILPGSHTVDALIAVSRPPLQSGSDTGKLLLL